MNVKQTGPISPKGKARSSMNAMKQGYTSKSPLINGELPHEWRQFYSNIKTSYPIVTPAQVEVVESIAIASWQLKRLNRLVEGDVQKVSLEPIRRIELEMIFGKSDVDSTGKFMPLISNSYEMHIDDGMVSYMEHQKVIRFMDYWESYKLGEDLYESELIDLMPKEIRKIFDERANKQSVLIDDYLVSTINEQDLEVIEAQLHILARVSQDYLMDHPQDQLKVMNWESAKALRIYEAYNQPSYQRSLATATRSLARSINLYQQLCTMHIDQVPAKKVVQRSLKNEAITDVDITH